MDVQHGPVSGIMPIGLGGLSKGVDLFMMIFVFAVLALALVVGWYGNRTFALLLVFVFFALAVKEFLWEIDSPDYGYRMPWIQVNSTVDDYPARSSA